jgi:hypothetical protein
MSLSGAVAVTRMAMLPSAYSPPARVRRERPGYRHGMSLFSKAARFARSPQGKKAMDKAKEFANKPETKEKIEQVREKVSGKDKQQASSAGSATKVSTPGSEPDSPGTAGTAPGSEPTEPAAGGTPPVNEPAAAGEQPAQGNPPQTS